MVTVDHNQGWKIGKLVRFDLFHILLRRKLYVSLPLLLSIWTLAIAIFAGFYYVTDRSVEGSSVCSLFADSGPIGYQGAFAFSLQTCTTVGYTLPAGNAFFENCPALQTLVFLQSIWSMLFNAFLIAFLYSRVARAESRSVQVIFGEKAIVNQTPQGEFRFEVRVYDVDAKHPVVEAKCRMYAVLKDRSVPVHLRLISPNDELGSPLFLSLPCVMAHHIDHYSPLHLPVDLPVETCGLTLRQVDSKSSSRGEVNCPVCGVSFGTVERWRAHVSSALAWERKGEYPVNGTHQALSSEQLDRHQHPELRYPPVTMQDISDYFRRHVTEVIVIVSAQDPLTSGSFQALQSYSVDEVVFDPSATFEPCIYVDKSQRKFKVDLKCFHLVRTHAERGKTASSMQIRDVEAKSSASPPYI
jgi:hypothetical protein